MRASHSPVQTLPLTAAQMGMWFGTRFASPEANFNLAEAIEIRGSFEPRLLQQALLTLCAEADSIRLRVADTPRGPRQWLEAEFAGSISMLDFSGDGDPRASAEQWMADESSRRMDVEREPLWSSAVLRIAPDHHIWYQRGHHYAFDGFAAVILARRVADLYTALVNGTAAPADSELRPLSVLIEEDQAYRDSARAMKDREYWMERMRDRPEPLTLAERRSNNIGGLLRHTAHWPAARVAALRDAAALHGATLPQVLIAATATYLYRMTGVSDMVIGVPVTARYNDRMRRVPGMVANAVPLRLSMRPELPFTDLLRDVSQQMRRILRHQAYRYERLRTDLELQAKDHELFTTVVNVEPFDYALRFGDCPTEIRNLTNGSLRDLGIFMYERGNGQDLRIDFDAHADLYTAPELAAHHARLLGVLDALTDRPAQAIGCVEVISADERLAFLSRCSGAVRAEPEAHLAELLDTGLSSDPGAIALRFEGRSMTRGKLDRQARTWAHRLAAMGAGPGRIVALAIPRSLELVAALVAVLRSGAAYLPIDPDFPADRLAFMLDDAQPACLMTTRELSGRFDGGIPRFLVDAADPQADLQQHAHAGAPPAAMLHPSHPAYVIYTSGSTGRPKGVVVPHSAIVNRLRWMQAEYELKADDRVLQKTPSSFDVSVWEFFWPLIAGATLVIARPGGHRDPAYLADLMAQEAVTTVHFVPSMLELFLQEHAAAACHTLRHVVCSGEALSTPLVARFHGTLGRCGLHNLYGPTEAAVDVTAWACTPEACAGVARIPIGRPIWNTRMYVLDPGLQPLPVGATGELYIAGDGLALGYLNRPALTAERFIADPHGPAGSRMYRTGDLARWRDDGTLEFLGRSDHQVKIRGLRIEPGEIESALMRHPGVQQAAVVVREDSGGDKLLVAYCVPVAGHRLDDFSLKAHVAQRVPQYMVPSAFVTLAELPLGPSGKLDRRALPDPTACDPGLDYAAPRTEAEKTLAGLWASALHVEKVGIHDNFFDLGGHSLMAIQLGMKIREHMHPDFPPAELYSRHTIAELAVWFDSNGGMRPATDLKAQIVLPEHIRRPDLSAPPARPQRVFLTGASGFVGSYLLATLLRETSATIICHVRAPDQRSGLQRLQHVQAERRLSGAWDASRVEIATGDLAAERLGMTDDAIRQVAECDAIYHCAAQVDYLHPYETLKPSNVDSVVTLLEWTAQGRPKALHYVSTLAVIGMNPETPVVTERSALSTPDGLGSGYAKSKWVADHLARAAQARGLPVAIYRLGAVTGDKAQAACNDTDMFWRVARLYAELGMSPQLDLPINLTPVDEVARAIVRLSHRQDSWGEVFHLLGSDPLHVNDMGAVFQQIGRPLQPTDLGNWMHHAQQRLAITQDLDLAALLTILDGYDLHNAVPAMVCAAATQERLEAAEAPIRSADRDLLRRYFENLGIGDAADAAGTQPAAALG
ncbi:non-ribosomal peptide synthetase [Paracidovorax cattleyae]|uniref:Amino acid adenylation domain-containing protein/thioester reductase domain-containing protein n=1 Tax=Paracidovorax cattleyae TaxID=80868 RepID=A0A1H0P9F7_9BURK|nr:non-ribosomal peptide synthetase [Paracidovorax cattleyae]AVS76075.1 non-ribosomal peptide synthetase [Paracidovorax cattleyae]SDP01345.1 amino acid adenylation domain-containing protein/thioester reductase domain-containing protein [Paracidovorax cattleyae]